MATFRGKACRRLYSAFAAELVRGRTFRRRYLPERSSPAGVLSSVNTILHQRQLEEYYCTLCYTIFDLGKPDHYAGELGPAVSDPVFSRGLRASSCREPLGSFQGSMADEVSFRLQAGDVFVFCTDGVFEAMNEASQEFTAERLLEVVGRSRDLPAKAIVDAIFAAVAEWRGETSPTTT